MRSMRCMWAAIVCITSLLSTAHLQAQTVDPAARYQTRRTPHFTIHFHGTGASVTHEIAGIAEETWEEVAARPGVAPPAMTHVVIADQSDFANGFAGPVPRNRIFLYMAAPSGTDRLNPRDWLRTLFIHEFAHIVHLDRSEGWARLARRIFGRTPWAFPNATLPIWHIEGLATWAESQRPGLGRQHAGDFLAITREAGTSEAPEPMDRANGGVTDWPGGLAPYAYGLGFHDYLARRFGSGTFDVLARETAGSLPYFGTRRFRRVYGEPLGVLWRAYQDELTTSSALVEDPVVPDRSTPLTAEGFFVSGPRWLDGACAHCGGIVYSLRTPHERGTIRHIDPATRSVRTVTTRVSGSSLGIMPDGRLVFDDPEVRRNVAVYGDLSTVDATTGSRRTLTTAARLSDPDVSHDGRWITAVQQREVGRRDLVVIDAAAVAAGAPDAFRVVASAPATQYNAPRWSPDGTRIVVSEQTGGAPSRLVIFDTAAPTPAKRILETDPEMRWVTPTWHPDGRTIVAGGAQGDGPYQLYAVALEPGPARQLSNVTGGATWPDVSRDGQTVAFVAESVTGANVHLLDYDTDTLPTRAGLPVTRWRETTAAAVEAQAQHSAAAAASAPAGDASPYRPWPTLLPTSWSPLASSSGGALRFGAGAGAADVLGYHAYAASALWAVNPPSAGTAHDTATPDWSSGYVYRRWRPQVFAAAARSTTFYSTTADGTGRPVSPVLVERVAQAGVQLPVRRMRYGHTAEASVVYAVDERRIPNNVRDRNRSGARLSWRFSSARRPGYAISQERGVTFGVAGEVVTPAMKASGRGQTFVGDVRVYAPGPARHHVLAIRVAAGTTRGDDAVRRVFLLGGSGSNPVAGTISSDGLNLMRGFATNSFEGTHAAISNVDYRFPIARPQRGMGAWPFLLHTVHAAAFVDVGHAWFDDFSSRDVKTSFGGELSADVVLGYTLPITVTIGAAYGRDGSGVLPSGARAYTRLGYAF